MAATGEVGAEVTVRARTSERLREWARRLDGDRLFAVEDGRHVSGHLEQFLLARGERSVRVATRMKGEPRRADRMRSKPARSMRRQLLQLPCAIRTFVATLAGPEREIGVLAVHRESTLRERAALHSRLAIGGHELDRSDPSAETTSVEARGQDTTSIEFTPRWFDRRRELT